uniref:Uncharacterized protein n=1 Tax=Ditylenchus dipsaci TaxID=166011 RepID=A0A915D1I6_9BILA
MERKGNSFLILTSHGTTGLATMDLAQNVFEGVVFSASDSEEKLQYLRDANVLSTLNWTDGKLTKNIHKKTFGDRVSQRWRSHSEFGSLLWYIPASQPFGPALQECLFVRHLAGRSTQEEIKENLEMLLRMFEEGFLKGLIKINKYPLEEVDRCVKEMQEPDFFGKAVLTMY